MDKKRRMKYANMVIGQIADCGRKFFYHRGNVSHFELDRRSRLWFVDGYEDYKICMVKGWGNRGFSEGGTLKALVDDLVNYIRTGEKLSEGRFGPWPEWYCNGDLWGYGEDMQKVRDMAMALGMIDEPLQKGKGNVQAG